MGHSLSLGRAEPVPNAALARPFAEFLLTH